MSFDGEPFRLLMGVTGLFLLVPILFLAVLSCVPDPPARLEYFTSNVHRVTHLLDPSPLLGASSSSCVRNSKKKVSSSSSSSLSACCVSFFARVLSLLWSLSPVSICFPVSKGMRSLAQPARKLRASSRASEGERGDATERTERPVLQLVEDLENVRQLRNHPDGPFLLHFVRQDEGAGNSHSNAQTTEDREKEPPSSTEKVTGSLPFRPGPAFTRETRTRTATHTTAESDQTLPAPFVTRAKGQPRTVAVPHEASTPVYHHAQGMHITHQDPNQPRAPGGRIVQRHVPGPLTGGGGDVELRPPLSSVMFSSTHARHCAPPPEVHYTHPPGSSSMQHCFSRVPGTQGGPQWCEGGVCGMQGEEEEEEDYEEGSETSQGTNQTPVYSSISELKEILLLRKQQQEQEQRRQSEGSTAQLQNHTTAAQRTYVCNSPSVPPAPSQPAQLPGPAYQNRLSVPPSAPGAHHRPPPQPHSLPPAQPSPPLTRHPPHPQRMQPTHPPNHQRAGLPPVQPHASHHLPPKHPGRPLPGPIVEATPSSPMRRDARDDHRGPLGPPQGPRPVIRLCTESATERIPAASPAPATLPHPPQPTSSAARQITQTPPQPPKPGSVTALPSSPPLHPVSSPPAPSQPPRTPPVPSTHQPTVPSSSHMITPVPPPNPQSLPPAVAPYMMYLCQPQQPQPQPNPNSAFPSTSPQIASMSPLAVVNLPAPGQIPMNMQPTLQQTVAPTMEATGVIRDHTEVMRPSPPPGPFTLPGQVADNEITTVGKAGAPAFSTDGPRQPRFVPVRMGSHQAVRQGSANSGTGTNTNSNTNSRQSAQRRQRTGGQRRSAAEMDAEGTRSGASLPSGPGTEGEGRMMTVESSVPPLALVARDGASRVDGIGRERHAKWTADPEGGCAEEGDEESEEEGEEEHEPAVVRAPERLRFVVWSFWKTLGETLARDHFLLRGAAGDRIPGPASPAGEAQMAVLKVSAGVAAGTAFLIVPVLRDRFVSVLVRVSLFVFRLRSGGDVRCFSGPLEILLGAPLPLSVAVGACVSALVGDWILAVVRGLFFSGPKERPPFRPEMEDGEEDEDRQRERERQRRKRRGRHKGALKAAPSLETFRHERALRRSADEKREARRKERQRAGTVVASLASWRLRIVQREAWGGAVALVLSVCCWSLVGAVLYAWGREAPVPVIVLLLWTLLGLAAAQLLVFPFFASFLAASVVWISSRRRWFDGLLKGYPSMCRFRLCTVSRDPCQLELFTRQETPSDASESATENPEGAPQDGSHLPVCSS